MFGLKGRTQEFHLGAVSHEHLLKRGQEIGLAATHYTLAKGAGSQKLHDAHMDRSGFHGFRSGKMNATVDVIPTGSMNLKKTRKGVPGRTPVSKVDQN